MKRSGFTLVELSIVLVILGLLVGGVLSGQSLIHAAELRSVTREVAQYQTALNAFKDKYFALPGDMKNAVKFWGAADGGDADGLDAACIAVTTPATGTETCNGDGDGRMLMVDNGSNASELLRNWQQLANAGLIEGTYTGVLNADGNVVAGENVGRSRYNGLMWIMMSNPTSNESGYLYYYRPGTIMLNMDNGSGNGVMSPEDLYNIDVKMDDGKPVTGVVTSNLLGPCVDGTSTYYNLSDTTPQCLPVFGVR